MKIQSTECVLGDWICVKLVLKKAQLCFKAFLTQGSLDPICLGSEVRIREKDYG